VDYIILGVKVYINTFRDNYDGRKGALSTCAAPNCPTHLGLPFASGDIPAIIV
jgi:hypothetical protein